MSMSIASHTSDGTSKFGFSLSETSHTSTETSKKAKPRSFVRNVKSSATFSFESMTKISGFTNARQLLKLKAVGAEKAKNLELNGFVKKKQAEVLVKHKIVRSITLGTVNSETFVQRTSKSKTGEDDDQLTTIVLGGIKSRNLSLAQMDLTDIPSSMLSTVALQLGTFNNVSLQRNKMSEIGSMKSVPNFSFFHLRRSTDLNLSGNSLGLLTDDFVFPLKHLTKINLSGNKLASLPPSFCRYLNRLIFIDISNNSMTELPRDIGNMQHLKELKASSNLISFLPNTFHKLEEIESLDMSSNSIGTLAIIPPFLTASDVWSQFVSTETKLNGSQASKVMYKHTLTGCIRENPPINEDDVGLSLQDINIEEFVESRDYDRYAHRRRCLSLLKIPEWEPQFDYSSGWFYYINRVSGESSWEIPSLLDTFGRLRSLKKLSLANNRLKSLPSSFWKGCVNMESLNLSRNLLENLQTQLTANCAVNLTNLNLSENLLSAIPLFLSKCSELQTLAIDSNQVESLPEWIGRLEKLQSLTATNNKLRRIPYSIGFLKDVESLSFGNNPLSDPPITDLSKPMPQLLYLLRQKYFDHVHGSKPPKMKQERFGVNLEVMCLTPEYDAEIQALCDNVKRTSGFLDFKLRGLAVIPAYLSTNEKLCSETNYILLDENPIQMDILVIPDLLSGLLHLSLRQCNLHHLAPSIHHVLVSLETLILDDNYLFGLSPDIFRNKSLKKLSLSYNRLYSLPEEIGRLRRLEELYLDGNRLDQFPNKICSLRKLRILSFSSNQISSLPAAFHVLDNLELLDFNRNQISDISNTCWSKFKNLKILRMGHNRICNLQGVMPNEPPPDSFNGELNKLICDGMFEPPMSDSLDEFYCDDNCVSQIPFSIVNLKSKMSIFHIDHNPLLSPPSALLSCESIECIQQYSTLRKRRIAEVAMMLQSSGFSPNIGNFTPKCIKTVDYELSTLRPILLTPDDDSEFDSSLNRYINGDFYQNGITGDEIVLRLQKLNDERCYVYRKTILDNMLKVIPEIMFGNLLSLPQKAETCSMFSSNEICSIRKPWGKDGEEVNCWQVKLRNLPYYSCMPPTLMAHWDALKKRDMWSDGLDNATLSDSLDDSASNCDSVGDTVTTGHQSQSVLTTDTKKKERDASSDIEEKSVDGSDSVSISLETKSLENKEKSSPNSKKSPSPTQQRNICSKLQNKPTRVKLSEVRPPIIETIQKSTPFNVFGYSLEQFEDAIVNFEHSYGLVGLWNSDATWPSCDCMDLADPSACMDQQAWFPCNHSPCTEPCIVLLKSIYTEKEAIERDEEEQDMLTRFCDVECSVVSFIDRSSYGTQQKKDEIEKRRMDLDDSILVHAEMVRKDKKKLKGHKAQYVKLEKRRAKYDSGGSYKSHKIDDIEKFKKDMEEAQTLVNDIARRIESMTEHLKSLKFSSSSIGKDHSRKSSPICKSVMSDIIRKYCVMEYDRRVQENRWDAWRKGNRRVWDGEDGCEFDKWLKKNMLTMHVDPKAQLEAPTRCRMKVQVPHVVHHVASHDDVKKSTTAPTIVPDFFDWTDIDSSSQWLFSFDPNNADVEGANVAWNRVSCPLFEKYLKVIGTDDEKEQDENEEKKELDVIEPSGVDVEALIQSDDEQPMEEEEEHHQEDNLIENSVVEQAEVVDEQPNQTQTIEETKET